MDRSCSLNRIFQTPSVIRRILTAWLTAVTVEYILLPEASKDLQELAGLAEMSFVRVILLTAALFAVLCVWNKPVPERWLLVGIFAVYAVISLCYSFTVPFMVISSFILTVLIVYAVRGWNDTLILRSSVQPKSRAWLWITAAASILFFLFISIWTVCRVLTFCTPTYDFGIFSQMFYNMKETGLPMTTVERDGLLSHFHVHVSPIYYLLLPFYCLFPYPATLQILQAAVLASAVIPLWLISKRHNLPPAARAMLCLLLLLYPAYSGGTSYDIHENAFLTPLLLWLFYGFDRKNILLTMITGILALMVKEDAAVYTAVIALFFLVNGLLHKDRWYTLVGTLLMCVSVIWFIAVTGFLARVGDGVMSYRYKNFMYDNSGSLLTVIKSVLMNPMKAVYECVDTEKLQFIAYTILPLTALPLFTRRYERYLLLIPYVLVNLMSDYQYQHNIFFQYTFGSTACLFYLTAVNLADIKTQYKRITALAAALCISIVTLFSVVVPKAISYPRRYIRNSDSYKQTEQILSLIPKDASVSATTFYTTYLSQRSVLYDVKYASDEHILSTEYVVLSVTDGAFEAMSLFLQNNGYSVFAELDGALVIYHRG